MRDSNSRLVQHFRDPHLWISLCNLAAGSCSDIETVSISIPRNTNLVLGPSVFPRATGTLRAAQQAIAHCRDASHCEEFGSPKIKKIPSSADHRPHQDAPGSTTRHQPLNYIISGLTGGQKVGSCPHRPCAPIS